MMAAPNNSIRTLVGESHLHIGCYFPPKKFEKMKFSNFLKYIEQFPNIKFTLLDPSKSLDEQGKVDVLVHKLTDELMSKQESQKEIIHKIKMYLQKHPAIVDIDPIESQEKVLDRAILGDLLNQIQQNIPKGFHLLFSTHHEEFNFKMPQYTVVQDTTQLNSVKNFVFPAVCKTVEACGSAESHHMGIVFHEKQLHQFKYPLLVQEFYNHNATIFKVFVIGDFIHVVKRLSLPNLPKEHDVILFDSQKPFDTQFTNVKRTSNKDDKKLMEETPEPPKEALQIISKAISDALGLTLFGFDLITQVETGQHAVIDINYFPTYGGVPNFEEVFLTYLVKRVKDSK